MNFAETVIFAGPRDADAWRRSVEPFAEEVLPVIVGRVTRRRRTAVDG